MLGSENANSNKGGQNGERIQDVDLKKKQSFLKKKKKFFGKGAVPCGILVPRPGIEPETQSLNHRTTRNVRKLAVLSGKEERVVAWFQRPEVG